MTPAETYSHLVECALLAIEDGMPVAAAVEEGARFADACPTPRVTGPGFRIAWNQRALARRDAARRDALAPT